LAEVSVFSNPVLDCFVCTFEGMWGFYVWSLVSCYT
jgi:hypothetical protein